MLVLVKSIVVIKMWMAQSVCQVDQYSDGVGILIVEEVVLTIGHNLVKRMWSFSTHNENLYTIGKTICVTYTSRHKHFALDDRFFLVLTFSAIKNFTTTFWYSLEAIIMVTLHLYVLPRYWARIWRDLRLSHAFPSLCALCRSLRSHHSFQMLFRF